MGFRNPITTAIDPTARGLANEALTNIIPGSRLAADAIDGKTITGATIQTAASGPRWVMEGAGTNATDRLYGYTGDTGEVNPSQLRVGVQQGFSSTNLDRGYVVLKPPAVAGGTVLTARPTVTGYGQSRDASDPGGWTVDGAVEFTGAVTFDTPPSVGTGLLGHGIATAPVGSITTNTGTEVAAARFSCHLRPGRALNAAAVLRMKSTVAGDFLGAIMRIARGPAAIPAATDPAIAVMTNPARAANEDVPMELSRWFQVTHDDTYVISLWGVRSSGTGTVTADVASLGDLFQAIVDGGLAPLNLPTITL